MEDSVKVNIRPYRSTDRQEVYRIGADTAFFGEPVEAYMEDRSLFFDSFYRYYTDLEPEHSWVASIDSGSSNGTDADQHVVGFLMGCVDTASQRLRRAREVIPLTFWRILTGKYHLGVKTIRYFSASIKGVCRGELPKVDLSVYPAHLHINVDAGWRGHGLGRRLMEAYLDHLRQLGIQGVYLETTSVNIVARELYERIGFTLLDSRATRVWEHMIDQPIYNLCYGLKLT